MRLPRIFSDCSPHVLGGHAAGIGRTHQGAHAAPGDDRGLQAQFVEDFQHGNMGQAPRPAAAQGQADFGLTHGSDRAPANVFSAKAAWPVNFSNCFIGFNLGIPGGFSKGGNVQHAASRGQKLAIFQGGAGVENLHIFAEILCEPLDFSAFDIVAGIALGGHDNGEREVIAPAHRNLVQRSINRCQQQRQQVIAQAHARAPGFPDRRNGRCIR